MAEQPAKSIESGVSARQGEERRLHTLEPDAIRIVTT